MPNLMTHLLLAKAVKPQGSPLFYLGSIAPDGVNNRADKDISHFRNLTDRQPALVSLAKETTGDFAEGVLLHLYCDWKWGTTILQKFIENTGEDWFPLYRNELNHVASHAFHSTTWAREVWDGMDMIDTSSYGKVHLATADDIKTHVARAKKWHEENVLLASKIFTLGLIADFVDETADSYLHWRKLQ